MSPADGESVQAPAPEAPPPSKPPAEMTFWQRCLHALRRFLAWLIEILDRQLAA